MYWCLQQKAQRRCCRMLTQEPRCTSTTGHNNAKHHVGQLQKVFTQPGIILKGCCPQAQSACSLETRWKNSQQRTKVKLSEAGMQVEGWMYCLESKKGHPCQPRPNSHWKEQTLPAGWESMNHPSVSETYLPAEVKDLPVEGKPFSLD